VLRSFIHWDRYPEAAWNDDYTIRKNIEAGKRPEQWLEGTSLRDSFRLLADGKTPPPPKQKPEISPQDLVNLRDALAKAEADGAAPTAADGKMSLRDLQNEAQEKEKGGENQKRNSQEMER
jgi:hypothetical protein